MAQHKQQQQQQDQMRMRNGRNNNRVIMPQQRQQLRNSSIMELEYPLRNLQRYVSSQDLSVVSFNRKTVNMELNANDQLRAAKFVTLMLARLWRRRRAEVCSIKALSNKFKERTDRVQSELIVRNQMLNTEQRRSEQLARQLRNAMSRIRFGAYSPRNGNMELKQLRNREALLRRDLDEKIKECKNVEELFASCKKDLFRELTQFRKSSEQLANEQRRSVQLEMLNADLQDELLTIKRQFKIQNQSVGRQQEQLEIAHETLRKYEQDLTELEIKHIELKRIMEFERQQNTYSAKNLRFIQNLLFFFQAGQRWDTLYSCWYQIGACCLNCFMPVCPMPLKPDYTVHLCLALVFLLASFY